MKYVPNALTIARILLAPLFLVLLFLDTFQAQLFALIVFVVAAISDWLDGQLARRYEVHSRLGMFLDPLADKILVLGAFIALPLLLPGLVPWWAVAAIALRDVVVTGLRLRAETNDRPLRTMPLAKTKTGLQLAYLIIVLILLTVAKAPGGGFTAEEALSILRGWVMYGFLLVVVVLTVYTGLVYLIQREPAQLKKRA